MFLGSRIRDSKTKSVEKYGQQESGEKSLGSCHRTQDLEVTDKVNHLLS